MKQKLFTLLTLALFFCSGAWADTELFSTDFSSASWSSATFSQGNTTTADVINGITFYSKSSTKQFSISSGELNFPDNNINSSNYFFAIPITGVNGSITITMTNTVSSSTAWQFSYVLKEGTSVSTPGGSGSKSTAGKTTTSVTISSLTKSDYVLYIGRSSSDDQNKKVKTITITTPAAATPHSVTYKANGGTGDDVVEASTTSIAGNTFTAPTGKTFWKWNTEADGSGDYYAVGATPEDDLVLYAQWVYQIFSMSNPTAPTGDITSKTGGDVTATFSEGSSAYVYNGKGGVAVLVNNGKIDLRGSNSSYLKATFTAALKQGDIIECSNTGAGLFKIDADDNNSGAVAVTFPYTIPAESPLIGKTSAYVFKDNGDATFSSLSIVRKAVTPVFSLTSTTITVEDESQIQVGTKGSLDGVTFDGEVTFGTDGVVTVDEDGKVSPVTTGTTTINFNTNAVREYYATTGNSLSITVNAAKTATTTAFSDPTTSVGVSETVTNVATVTGGPVSPVVTYSSDDTDIATVNSSTGEVRGVAVGSTTIRASYAGDEDYKASSASYTINVTQSAVNSKSWTSGAFLTAVGGSNTNVTGSRYIDNMEIKGTATAIQITTGGAKTIDGGSVNGRVRFGKAGSSDGNYLHFKVKPNTKITFWGIRAGEGAEANGLAISFGSFGTNEKVYSFEGGDVESFTYYYLGTGNTDVYAYSKNASGASMMKIKVESVSTTTITPGYNKTTYVTAENLDFTDAIGLKAYVATAAGASGVTMTPVGTVPSKTPLLLVGTAGTTYNIPIVASADAPATNKLVAGDGTTDMSGVSGFNYILYSDGLFYQVTSGTIATTKAYLHLDSAPGAHALDIIFDESGEATGITEVTNGQQTKANGQYFNLAGQRVNTNHKGIVIVNGKKYFNK